MSSYYHQPRFQAHSVQAEIRILGGFPVIAHGRMCPKDPSVGIDSPYLEDVAITTLKGTPCPFLEKRLTKQDWALIESDLYAAL